MVGLTPDPTYNVGSKNGKVSALDEWNDSLDSIVEVVVAEAQGIVADHVGELEQRLVLKYGVPDERKKRKLDFLNEGN